ncbi:hypothetical protein WJX72_010115 [[Myrmecia] bisecta]|uniref:TPX2 C-terminal domain-containing protein n=1 Tax=[Myrmecia] bisecta TaxID=41462 RepID=A0AAW1QSG5_9CHLO
MADSTVPGSSTAIDPHFEFNAPQFYDFDRMSVDGSEMQGDTWFDTAATKGLRSPVPKPKPTVEQLAAAQEAASTAATSETTEAESKPAAAAKPKVPSNLVTSWGPTNEETLNRALQPRVAMPARSTKPLTEPMDVEFNTAKRRRLHNMETRAGSGDVEMGTTPQWKSLAQQVVEFQRKTPQRFHTRAKQDDVPQCPPHEEAHITDAKAPRFATDSRKRPSHFKSREELEAEEMQSMPHFHARPVNPLIMAGSGQYGVPKVDPRPLTEAHSPHLATDRRAAAHPAVPQDEAPAPAFKAQPLNKRILEGRTFEPKRNEQPLTQPQSPKLSRSTRSQAQAADPAPFVFKAKAAPVHDDTRTTRSQQKRQAAQQGPTVPRPFSLTTDKRGESKTSSLQRALAEKAEAEKAARSFRAGPVPPTNHRPAVLPKPAEATITVPAPFALASEARHEEAAVLRELQNTWEEEQRQAQAHFKARPVMVAEPFAVEPSDKPVTVPEGPKLALEERSLLRHQFDAEMAAKERMLEAEKRAKEAKRRKEEEEAVKAYRKGLAFKARPMPNFNAPFLPGLSAAKLTESRSPAFCTRSRTKIGQ